MIFGTTMLMLHNSRMIDAALGRDVDHFAKKLLRVGRKVVRRAEIVSFDKTQQSPYGNVEADPWVILIGDI
jgi:hypothetical protein